MVVFHNVLHICFFLKPILGNFYHFPQNPEKNAFNPETMVDVGDKIIYLRPSNGCVQCRIRLRLRCHTRFSRC